MRRASQAGRSPPSGRHPVCATMSIILPKVLHHRSGKVGMQLAGTGWLAGKRSFCPNSLRMAHRMRTRMCMCVCISISMYAAEQVWYLEGHTSRVAVASCGARCRPHPPRPTPTQPYPRRHPHPHLAIWHTNEERGRRSCSMLCNCIQLYISFLLHDVVLVVYLHAQEKEHTTHPGLNPA